MLRKIYILIVCVIFSVSAFAATDQKKPDNSGLNSAQIEQLTGAKGQFDQKEKVFKVSVPRADLNLTIGNVKLIPAMGLTS